MNKNIIVSLFVLLAGTLACAVPAGMTPTPIVITQVVVLPNEPEEQIQATPTLPSLTIPPATDTLSLTATTASTAITAPTATLRGPIATFVKNANCRNGPGTTYPVVTSFFEGETVQIVGRSPNFNNTWWYVNIPSGGRCWVSLTTAQAYGDFDDIPTVIP